MTETDALPTLIVTQLLVQSPVLFVYFAGGLFALTWWRRSPTASLLALIGCVLLLLDGLAVTLAGAYLTVSRARLQWSTGQYTAMLSALGWIGSLVRALGTGLLLGAAFAARSDPARGR